MTMNKTKLLTAILGLSIAGNAAVGIYAAKLNEDVDIAYRVADDMKVKTTRCQRTTAASLSIRQPRTQSQAIGLA